MVSRNKFHAHIGNSINKRYLNITLIMKPVASSRVISGRCTARTITIIFYKSFVSQ